MQEKEQKDIREPKSEREEENDWLDSGSSIKAIGGEPDDDEDNLSEKTDDII
jgi:hypothetical protein